MSLEEHRAMIDVLWQNAVEEFFDDPVMEGGVEHFRELELEGRPAVWVCRH